MNLERGWNLIGSEFKRKAIVHGENFYPKYYAWDVINRRYIMKEEIKQEKDIGRVTIRF